MYDFQGMNSRLASFRQLEPFEGHQVRNLSWSPTSDRFLCVTGSAQAKVLLCMVFFLCGHFLRAFSLLYDNNDCQFLHLMVNVFILDI